MLLNYSNEPHYFTVMFIAIDDDGDLYRHDVLFNGTYLPENTTSSILDFVGGANISGLMPDHLKAVDVIGYILDDVEILLEERESNEEKRDANSYLSIPI